MTKWLSAPQSIILARITSLAQATFSAAIAFHLAMNPAFAGDPFRDNNPRAIGDKTEAAFRAVFQKGNYPEAENYLKQALANEPNEPLAYAMRASLAYTNNDVATLATYSTKTLEAGQKLIATDPLRGNLYTAVGTFLEGAVIITREGAGGAAQALGKLRQVYQYLDKAEAISANDPELNLIKGYMDLLLAVNLPFTNPDEAIQRLEKNAAPQYLVDRGIAIAYRDLKNYSQALDYANRAVKATADNPEVYYLKAQILHEQGRQQNSRQLLQDAIANFDIALGKKSQLPADLVKQIQSERSRANDTLKSLG
ncbi:tetratricopeptide repeat protein [Calothrix sp. FACHB-1219]|uniref:Sll0314/Alr1548 family TPR repeat-containing protein n=1 Tax=unclassified Calothrix TaxID=2619626 RepID=UPI001686D209|nr:MULTISPECIES: Sll0314/Alr1548 family TPR repeat-containing protein [unclassified Calothrix]MBD2204004.1 tetratricopeptide repeat protein [Calothrix sp. FACHB-168]MBD2218211.1 tetratricopeptide repeat protein [Calothrix sp. FACHB-1219]